MAKVPLGTALMAFMTSVSEDFSGSALPLCLFTVLLAVAVALATAL